VHVIWSFRELRRHVESGECTIVLLDADLFEGSLRAWIEELCALESILVLVAASRAAEWKVTELLAERLVYRLLTKPAVLDTTRTVLDVVISRHLQLSTDTLAPRNELEVASGHVAVAENEIPQPQNELLALRAAAARSDPIRAPPRRPVAKSGASWPAWFLATGLVGAIIVTAFLGDFAPLELLGTSDDNQVVPAEPSFAAPVDVEAPPVDQVIGRTEDAVLPDSRPAAEPASAGGVAPDAEPPEPPAVLPDAALTTELPVADTAPALAESDADPSATSPSAAAPSAAPAVGPPAVRSPAVGPPAPESAVVAAATPPPELESVLATAWSRVRQDALLGPPGDSARDYVERAALLAPGHPDVIAIRSLLAEAVADSARLALESGDLEGAETLADEALRLGAPDETLAMLDIDLAAARDVGARRMHSELLRRGVERIRSDRLIAPENDNALAYLGRLRAENPTYPGLDSAWQGLGRALATKVERSMAAGDWAGAEAWLEPLALVDSPATIERFRAELAVKRLQSEPR
jgi:hypothetical protein